jgi:hypothetical protein
MRLVWLSIGDKSFQQLITNGQSSQLKINNHK